MKVTVTKYLNVRVGKPSVNAPCYQYLAPGSEIITDGKIYEGDEYDKIKTWVKDEAGNYYWTGGILAEPATPQVKQAADYDQFIKQFDTRADKIGVALLDSGLTGGNQFLAAQTKLSKSHLPGNSMQNISAHGTKVAGVLATSDATVNRNLSRLYSFRVADQNNSVDGGAVKQSLLDVVAIANQVDIVNMSIDIQYKHVGALQPIIDQLLDLGVLAVVAAGENNYLNNTAFLQNVIRVASFDSDKVNSIKSAGLKTEYTCSFLNEPVSTYDLNGDSINAAIEEDSAYCAVVSSLLARWMQSRSVPKSKARLTNAQTFLKNISLSIKTSLVIKPFNLYI